MNQTFIQSFVAHNQHLTDKPIDETVVEELFDIRSVEQYIKSDLFKESSKQKIIEALRAARESNQSIRWITRGNKRSLTVGGAKTRDTSGINFGYPENHMLNYVLEPSGNLYLQTRLTTLEDQFKHGIPDEMHFHFGTSEPLPKPSCNNP